MSNTQAKRIRSILLDAIKKYNASINLDTSGRAYSEIVTPVYDALSPDMFEDGVEDYLVAAIKEQYPSLDLQDGDLVMDLLIRPLQILLEPMKREINLLRKRQSVRYESSMTLEDAEDLAANFFIKRKVGSVAAGFVRILVTNPTYITINSGVRFSTVDNLGFVPARQEFIPASVVAGQREGNFYYADVQVVSEEVGTEYNVEANTIVRVEGLPGFAQVTNPDAFVSGQDEETKQELLQRVEASLTERSLTSRIGINARLASDFTSLDHVQVIGFGDPEMDRDILVGSGDGELIASGVSLLFGRYVFMLTGYENADDGNKLPQAGDTVKLNFWKFIYGSTSVETLEIQDIVYSSYGDAKDSPTVHIFLLKSAPTSVMEPTGAVPGVLPGVFVSVFTDSTITVSGVPGGIYDDGNALPTRLASNEVHIGGKYDVWVMPSEVETDTTTFTVHKSPDVKKEINVSFDGVPESTISGLYPHNRISFSDYVITTSAALTPRSVVTGATNKSTAFISKAVPDTTNTYILTCRSGIFSEGETLTESGSGTQVDIVSIEYTAPPVSDIESVLTVTASDSTVDSYYVLRLDENYYVVHKEIDFEDTDLACYVHSETGLDNMLNPRLTIFPSLSEYATGLQTYIGRSDVYVSQDLLAAGVTTNDSLEILSGTDRGLFTISEISQHTATVCKLEITPNPTKTNSNLRFRVIRATDAVSAPFVSMLPGGVVTQTDDGVETIPYAKSVGGYAVGSFSGTVNKSSGFNGFALPNLGPAFKGAGAHASDISKQPDQTVLSQFTNTKFDDCISEGCSDCEGIPVVIVVTIDGQSSSYSSTKTYIEGLTSSQANSYLTSLRTWMHSIVESFFRGTNSTSTTTADDLDAFIDMFSPFTFGQPTSATENIISRIEMCVPNELFDGCNNIYMALPEIDWDTAFESVSTFEQAIVDFLAGDLFKEQPALSYAKPGDALKIQAGANKGEYVIDKVINFPMYTDSSIQTEITQANGQNASVTTYAINEARVFNFTVVVLRGELPEEVLKGASDFFLNSIPNVTSILPVAPSFPNTVEVRALTGANAGNLVNPFSVVEDIYTTTFKALYAQGFDLPEEFELEPGPTLTKIVKKFFSEYSTGLRSPQQTIRMLFQDPIDVTIYSPKVRSEITWRPEVLDSPVTQGQEPIALPMPVLGGTTLTVEFTRNLDQESTTLTGTVSSSVTTITDIDDFVKALQDALDPNYSHIMVNYSESSVESGFYYIQVQALFGGEGSYLYAQAEGPEDGFYLLGYTSVGVTKNRTKISLSSNIIPNGSRLDLFYSPASLAKSYLYLGASMANLWIIDTYATYPSVLTKQVNDSINISLILDDGTVRSLTGITVANLNENTQGALLVYLNNASDTMMRDTLSSATDSISFTDSSGVTTVVDYPNAPNLSTIVHSTDDEEFNLCFGNFGSADSSLFPYSRDSASGYYATESASLVWDTTSSQVVTSNNRSFTISSSIELTMRIEHTQRGVPPTVTLTLPPTDLGIVVGSATTKTDLFSLLFSDTSIALEGGTVSTTVLPTIVTSTIPLEVTVGSDPATEILTDISQSTLLDLESSMVSATTITPFKVRLCSLLNSEMGDDPTAVFVPLVGNYIALLPLTNTSSSISVSGSYPVNSNYYQYGFSLFDYIVSMSSNGTPSTRSTSPGVNSPLTGSNGSSAGRSSASTSSITKVIQPNNGTRFSLTQGGEERQLVSDIQNNEDYYYGVYPRKHANLEILVNDMDRDCVFTANYTDAEACTMYLGSTESSLSLGVQTGDYIYVYEHKEILDNSNMSMTPFSPKKDRVLHVAHNDARREITLLSTSGTFLNPETLNTANNQTPGANAVKVGDLVFFEAVGEHAVVTTVKDKVVTLSKSVSGTPSEKIITSGNNGNLTDDTFVDVNYRFTTADIGKYLVIYGAESENVDGSYAITTVSLGGEATIESTSISEANLHWALVKPGVTTPGSSTINGRTSTVGVTPVRIYSGTPAQFRVGRVSSDIAADKSRIEVLYGNSILGPKRGVRQPFKILRDSECRMTAAEMAEQGTESSLYYFDVPATTLTPTYTLNIKEDTQCTPVFRTYKSAGYYFTVQNKSTVFSTREVTKLHITSGLISQESSGSLTAVTISEKASVSASYYTSSTVSRVQTLVSSSANKSITADPLVRHFLPSYTYITFSVLRGDTEGATEAVIDYVNSLQPDEELRLSKVEKQLHAFELDMYTHPTFMYCLTTDLDRNVILTRSNNFVDDSNIQHNGTNRITNYIATDSTISLEGE